MQVQNAFSGSALHENCAFCCFMCQAVSERQQFVVCRTTHSVCNNDLMDGLFSSNSLVLACGRNATPYGYHFVTLSFIFRLLLSSAAFFHSSPGGRRCGVHEADCRGIGRTIPCVLGDRPRPLWDSIPCIKSHASAGQLVIHFVTGQMVGDRRFSEAAMLGSEFFHFFREPSCVGPADWSRASRCLVVWAVFEMKVQHVLTGAISCQSFWHDVAASSSQRQSDFVPALRRPRRHLLRQRQSSGSRRCGVHG